MNSLKFLYTVPASFCFMISFIELLHLKNFLSLVFSEYDPSPILAKADGGALFFLDVVSPFFLDLSVLPFFDSLDFDLADSFTFYVFAILSSIICCFFNMYFDIFFGSAVTDFDSLVLS